MIVFCHLLNDHSGSPRVLSSTLRAFRYTEECRLFIGSTGNGVLSNTGVPIRKYWYRRSRYRIFTFFGFLFSQVALWRALSRERDIPPNAVVYVNTLLPFAGMLWGKLTGRPVIVHVHEISIRPTILRTFLTRCASKCADRLVYVSNDHKARLPINIELSRVVLNPIDSEIDRQCRIASPYYPRRSGSFQILMLASLRVYKGVSEFMELARCFEDRSDISFVLVLSEESQSIYDFKKVYGDRRNVKVYGRTDNPSIFYQSADLLLNLSRVDQCIETFGLTIVEAMAFSIPVIVPPIGGPSEIVTDGCEGYCIDSRDIGALQSAVNELADNPGKAMRMSASAHRRATEFSFDAFTSRIRHVVEELKPRPPGNTRA